MTLIEVLFALLVLFSVAVAVTQCLTTVLQLERRSALNLDVLPALSSLQYDVHHPHKPDEYTLPEGWSLDASKADEEGLLSIQSEISPSFETAFPVR